MMRSAISVASALALIGAGGCVATTGRVQEVSALEVRDTRSGFGESFDAAVESLFDAGYIIDMVDRPSGVVRGHRVIWPQSLSGSNYISLTVTLQRQGAGYRVRATTTDAGTQTVLPSRINEFWKLMREHVALSPVPEAAGAKGR